MDILDFAADSQESTAYDYKILVYPNITYQKDLERDSYIVVIREALKYMTEHHPNVHWTLILPHRVDSLVMPHVEQKFLDMPTYPNTMRTHFNAFDFLKLVDWRHTDYDIVYSHLPEHTAQISNVMNNQTNIIPKIIGYCHWFEVPENTAYAKTMLWANLGGLLEMDTCGVNSDWLKKFILGKYADMVSRPVLKRLENIIQPHHLGIDRYNLDWTEKEGKTKVIFNHRANEYTGWNWFVKAMDEIWETRQDFTVYTTLANCDRPWCVKEDLPTRAEYLNFLGQMHFGVGCFDKYSAWSISTTDGMSRGTPYLLPNKLVYPEMLKTTKMLHVKPEHYPMWYSDQEDFKRKFTDLLNRDTPRQMAFEYLCGRVPEMMWNETVSQWFGGWDIFDLKPLKSKSEGYKRILDFIESNGYVTKNDIIKYLNWGVGIKWSPYRNLLRSEDHIRFTKTGYEVIK